MDKVTVCLIVKNEETCLRTCLESVNGLGQLVIVDTGSTDKTIEIAKEFTDNVYTDYEWADDFSAARNHAISKCKTNWILSIDADHVLVDKATVHKAIAHAERYALKVVNIDMVSSTGTSLHKQPLLYMNSSDIFWKGAIHNYLNISAEYDSDIIEIYGYSEAHKKDPDRAFRILAKEVKKPGMVRELYYYAREFYYRKRYDEAIQWYTKYLNVAYWAPEIADTRLMMAKSYKLKGDLVNARKQAVEAILINADYKEAVHFIADLMGPINSEKWLYMAYIATNTNVLFINEPVEQKAAYYDKYMPADDFKRYNLLYKEVGEMVKAYNSVYNPVLDIGCGTGLLAGHIDNYTGIDFSKDAITAACSCANVSVRDLYEYDYYDKDTADDFSTYTIIEVLEHIDDLKLLNKLQKGKYIICSVPSFYCVGHVRRYTERIVRERYRDLIDIKTVKRFNLKDGVWTMNSPATNEHITLFGGITK